MVIRTKVHVVTIEGKSRLRLKVRGVVSIRCIFCILYEVGLLIVCY